MTVACQVADLGRGWLERSRPLPKGRQRAGCNAGTPVVSSLGSPNYTNNSVSIQAWCLTNENVRIKREVYYSTPLNTSGHPLKKSKWEGQQIESALEGT
jgi:hypothetical protein